MNFKVNAYVDSGSFNRYSRSVSIQIWKKVIFGAGLLACLVPSADVRGADWNAGPLYDEFELTLGTGFRREAAGPFFYFQEKETEQTWAIPPLIGRWTDSSTDSEEFDFLYPLLSYDRFGTEHRWHFFQLLSFSGGQNQDNTGAKRFTIFPFYFQQRSLDPELNYTALFPIYGHLKNRLLRDEIHFVLFPLYAQTRKRDVVTDNYLYPFYHVRRGNGLKGWQLLPFAGHERKEITSRTNNWGDVELVPGHETRFVLWPFYLSGLRGIGTENPVKQEALLPFYSLERSPARDSTTVLWPFLTYVDDRARQYTEWQTPWPLVVFARGEGKTTSRIFPFFSRARTATHQSDFYLWPIYKFNRLHSDPLDRQRTRILLFLYSDTIQKNTATGAFQRRRDFWPLYSHRRDYDGSTRLQVLAILEPILPTNKSIERDYSHLWSLWRSERNAKTGAASQSLLWNLYRRDITPESRKGSLLFGLFQYESEPGGKRARLFYVPFGGRGAPDRAAVEPGEEF
jgi:hypothetical protein